MSKNGNTKASNLQKSSPKMVVKKLKLKSWEQEWVEIEEKKKRSYLKGQPIKRMQERMILKRRKYF
jgi:hypothetical protein